MPQSKFTPAQAEELAAAFARRGRLPLHWQERSNPSWLSGDNERRIWIFSRTLGFPWDPALTMSILTGSEIVLIKSGPFALDLIHAPDGIESFEAAKSRRVMEGGRFPVASLEDIIASKRATGREKDFHDIRRLQQFKVEYERRQEP